MNQPERELQIACFTYFRLQYPLMAGLYFAIPNGGSRNVREAVNLKRSGTLSGVADTFLAFPTKYHHGLWIEFKSLKGKMSDNQMTFQAEVVEQGYEYRIVNSFDEFIKVIKEYLK